MPDRRSLGGLPPDLAQRFTQRIQPIISNRCGNSRCHGDGRNSFTVVHSLRRSTPQISELNLAAVLNHINFSSPDSSPLLKATQGLHGGSRQLLFPHRTGGLQAKLLREWVFEAAEALAEDSPSIKTVSADIQPTNINQIESLHERSDEVKRNFVDAAVIATRHDEFDPRQFNRRYHGHSNRDAVRTPNAEKVQ